MKTSKKKNKLNKTILIDFAETRETLFFESEKKICIEKKTLFHKGSQTKALHFENNSHYKIYNEL